MNSVKKGGIVSVERRTEKDPVPELDLVSLTLFLGFTGQGQCA